MMTHKWLGCTQSLRNGNDKNNDIFIEMKKISTFKSNICYINNKMCK